MALTLASNAITFNDGTSLSSVNITATGTLSARSLADRFADVINVKDFGAKGDGVADDTAAIQAALNTSSKIFFPAGTYKISAPLELNNNNFLTGVFWQSIILSTHNGAALRGKGVTPSSGTNIRRYYGGGSNLQIKGPGTSLTSSIGLDMRGCSGFKWNNIIILDFARGVYQGNNYSTYYNEYNTVDMIGVTIGYENTTLGNENLVVGGRVNQCQIGTIDSDCSHNKYVGCAIEVFTTGHAVSGATAVGTTYIASRLEGGITGISINSSAQDIQIISPYYQAVSTEVTDLGTYTGRFDAIGLKIRGSSLISTIFKQTINKAIGPINAGTISQVSFTVTPSASMGVLNILPNDAVFITVPQTWPATLIAGQPFIGGTNLIYLPVYNISGSPVSLAAANYVITVIKGT